MLKHFIMKCNETCAKTVELDIDPETNKIFNVKWSGGGCEALHSALSELCEGQDCLAIYHRLKHSPKCGRRNTSCALELIRLIDSL